MSESDNGNIVMTVCRCDNDSDDSDDDSDNNNDDSDLLTGTHDMYIAAGLLVKVRCSTVGSVVLRRGSGEIQISDWQCLTILKL